MPDPLTKLEAGGDVRQDWRAVNALIDYLDPASAGRTNFGDGRKNFLAGRWRFASPREYDPDKDYEAGEVVVVSDTNPEVALGNATAGLWVCLQAGSRAARFDAGDPTIYEPIWPLPNVDPDHADNYWMLIAFYPTVMTYCLGGIDTDYYVNAQPVPAP